MRTAKTALLLAGCCLAAMPISRQSNPALDAAAQHAADRAQPFGEEQNAAAPPPAMPSAPPSLIVVDDVSPTRALAAKPPESIVPAIVPKPSASTAKSLPPPEPLPPPVLASLPRAVKPLDSGTTELAGSVVPPPVAAYTGDPLPAPPIAVDVAAPPTPVAAGRLALAPRPAQVVNLPPAAAARPIPAYSEEPLPSPPLAVNLPEPSANSVAVATAPPVPAPRPSLPGSSAAEMRPADIAQISGDEAQSLRVPQLHEPGLVPGGGPTLAARIAAMQVTPLPPARLPDSERATLLAEAPTQMTVRIGGTAVGQVDFRMTETRTIDVKLSALLDLLSQHYDQAEFGRLRSSAAADSYVSFDKLRAMGLKVRYDPAYDEVRIDG